METNRNLTIEQVKNTFNFLRKDAGRQEIDIDEIQSEVMDRNELMDELSDARYKMRKWLKYIQSGMRKKIESDSDIFSRNEATAALEEISQFIATLLYFSQTISDWNRENYNLLNFIEENLERNGV